MPAFIEASAVDKSYVVGTTRLTVLQGLSLSIDKGEMVAIVGASGVNALLPRPGRPRAGSSGSVRIGDVVWRR